MPATYKVPMTTVAAAPNAGPSYALSVTNLQKIFGRADNQTRALDGVSFNVAPGEFIAIMGPSGSGKTTLLNCISTIERPSKGAVYIDSHNLASMNRRALAKFRRNELGFIFQDFNLLDTLNGFENIALALTIRKMPPKEISKKVKEMAKALGVEEVMGKYPFQMSGGQQQRVAAARAMIGDPKLILADEPTGALDSHSASVMLESMELMNTRLNATILMVTHDSYAASYASRVLFLTDGRIFSELRRGASTREGFFTQIMEVVSFLGGGKAGVRNADRSAKEALDAAQMGDADNAGGASGGASANAASAMPGSVASGDINDA